MYAQSHMHMSVEQSVACITEDNVLCELQAAVADGTWQYCHPDFVMYPHRFLHKHSGVEAPPCWSFGRLLLLSQFLSSLCAGCAHGGEQTVTCKQLADAYSDWLEDVSPLTAMGMDEQKVRHSIQQLLQKNTSGHDTGIVMSVGDRITLSYAALERFLLAIGQFDPSQRRYRPLAKAFIPRCWH